MATAKPRPDGPSYTTASPPTTGPQQAPQKLHGRFGLLTVITPCDDRSEHPRGPRRRLRPLPGGQDHRAGARGLLPHTRWRDDPGRRAMARGPADPRTARRPDRPSGGWRGFRLVDGWSPSAERKVVAARGRGRRSWWRDRQRVQRPEVRVGHMGAGRSVAAPADRERTRQRRRADGRIHARARPGGPPSLRRRGGRGSWRRI